MKTKKKVTLTLASLLLAQSVIPGLITSAQSPATQEVVLKKEKPKESMDFSKEGKDIPVELERLKEEALAPLPEEKKAKPLKAQTKTSTTGRNGTVDWTLDEERGVVTFTSGGTLEKPIYEMGAGTAIKKIIFQEVVAFPGNSYGFFRGDWDKEKQLQSIEGLEKVDTSNVTDMGYMFYNTALESLDLSTFDTSKVTNMSHMFYGTAIKELTFGNKFKAGDDTELKNPETGKWLTTDGTLVYSTSAELLKNVTQGKGLKTFVWGEGSVYTVTFKNADGKVLKTQQVDRGKAAQAPTAPTRKDYTFTSWGKSFNNITGNLTVTANINQSR